MGAERTTGDLRN